MRNSNILSTYGKKGQSYIMIKVAFCDNDMSVLGELRYFLDRYCTKYHQEIAYTTFYSSLELLAEIEKGVCYDILFLEILLPKENGISIAKEIRQYDSVVKIIFLTSSPEFAVQSYTVGAYYYQIKPILEEDFCRLIDAAVSECKKEQHSLILRCKSGITRIDLERLEYCEVRGRTRMFHMDSGKVLEDTGSMDELYGKLSQYENFIRPHRSFLVNMAYIQQISHRTITMENQAEIPIPHGKCSKIKNLFLKYAFDRI